MPQGIEWKTSPEEYSTQFFMESNATVTNPTVQLKPVNGELFVETTYSVTAGVGPSNGSWDNVEPLPDADGQAYTRIDLDGRSEHCWQTQRDHLESAESL